MMDEDSNNIDPFSSLIISSNHNQDDNFLRNKDEITRKKLKAVRKRKDVIVDGSSINSLRYKLKVKYGGQFRPINKGKKEKYCYGKQRTLYFEEVTSSFVELLEDVSRFYHEDESLKLCFFDNRAATQSFIQLEDEESYRLMLKMYEEKKEVVIYATLDKMIQGDRVGEDGGLDTGMCIGEQENYEEWSDYCHSEESYHSLHSDSEDETDEAYETSYEGEFYLYDKDDPKMEVGAKYPHVVAFRRALNHYAIINDFEYESSKTEPARVTANCANPQCSWRIHATVAEDGITFIVRTLQQKHTCYGINKRGNKHATQGWVEDRVINDLRKESDISVKVLKQRLESKFGVSVPYQRVWQGKELALGKIYGNWKDSFVQTGALREELRERNPGSVVELKVEPLDGGSRHFQRFFVALEACTTGFLIGCRPYLSLDACHLKGKWNGVIAAATAIDGNNWMFPVAFAVMENESQESWEWFLRLLHDAIGMPEGLVISSDMQKGLNNAIENVYPLAEHRECMRHLFKNFKKKYRGDFFRFGLWGAARTYSQSVFDALIAEIEKKCPAAKKYLDKEHDKLWSRSKFGTISKCDYLTNNIAEVFNSWISEERQKPIINLIDSIRQKIMVRFDERRRIVQSWKGPIVPKVVNYIQLISRGLNGYSVHKSLDFAAEITKNELRWEVNLEERRCSCRAWQVKGVPCVHAAALIASIRNVRWEDYVDPYFTVARLKTAYAHGIAPMPSKDKWVKHDLGYKMLPPILKRPVGRPKKMNRIKASDEPTKRSHKCTRCGSYGHYRSTCKNAVPSQENENGSSAPRTHGSRQKRGANIDTAQQRKRACPPNIFKLLEEENI